MIRPDKQSDPLTAVILREQLAQISDDAIVEIGGVTMSQASYAFAATMPGGKLQLFFVPLLEENS